MSNFIELNPNDTSIKCRLPMHQASSPASLQISSRIIPSNDHYTLRERAFGHLIIRTSFENKSIPATIKSVTGLEFPIKPLSSTENKEYIINWISPNELLLLVPERTEFEIESKLRESMTGHFAIVNVTGGQTLLELSGKRAESIIKKSSSYDIHPSNMPIGKVVTTIFAKSQAVLRRTSDDSFQLIIRRSFSDYLRQWMVDAGSRE